MEGKKIISVCCHDPMPEYYSWDEEGFCFYNNMDNITPDFRVEVFAIDI